MLISLKVIYEMLEEVNQSTNNKEGLLRNYLIDPIFGQTLRKVLTYMADTKHIFSLKKIKYCVYFNDPTAAEYQNVDGIFQMLNHLNKLGSDPSENEIIFLEKISSADPETVEIVTRILNKQTVTGLTNERIMEILGEG